MKLEFFLQSNLLLLYLIKKHFMMKNQNDIGEDFKVIEDIIGKIDSYEVNQENSYLIRLQNKKEKIVRFNNYNQFTLFSLDVD